MVGRGELTEAAWAVIAPLLPAPGRRGGQWRDHRQVINRILWKLRTGAPWRSAMGHGRRARSGSTAGDATGRGIGCWPACRPNRTRRAQRPAGES